MKRRAILGLLALIIAAGAFASGLYVGERRVAHAVAEHELAAFLQYMAVLGFVRSGDLVSARSSLYTATDGPLSVFSLDNAQSLGPESQEILAKWIKHLNRNWSEDKPFEGGQWSSVRTMPGWIEMRARNDKFRQTYRATQ